MDKIQEVVKLFEWAWGSKPRLFSLGIICGGLTMYFVHSTQSEIHAYNIQKLRDENKDLQDKFNNAQTDCLNKIMEVKEFLKKVAE